MGLVSDAYYELAGLVTFRPLSITVPVGDVRSQFSASWSDTVRLLGREIRHLRPREALLEAGFTDGQLRLDGLPRATARPWTEAVVLTLVGARGLGNVDLGDLRYPCGTYRSWQDNVRAIALALEALRKVDRYGVTRRGEQYAGWKQLGAGTGVGEGDPARGRKLIEAAGGDVKAALKAAHPDHGGEADDFRDVMAARGEAL